MHVLRVIFPGKEDPRPPVVSGVLLLEEWLLSFDAIAMCLAIRSPMDDAATTHRVMIIPVATCLSFGLTGIEG
jgi:EamA domain-containing membrane protein RarD